MINEYEYILVEVYFDKDRNKKRIRPCPNQKFKTTMKVECSHKMKDDTIEVGTIFKIKVKLKEPKSTFDEKHLYSSYKWPFEVISD